MVCLSILTTINKRKQKEEMKRNMTANKVKFEGKTLTNTPKKKLNLSKKNRETSTVIPVS